MSTLKNGMNIMWLMLSWSLRTSSNHHVIFKTPVRNIAKHILRVLEFQLTSFLKDWDTLYCKFPGKVTVKNSMHRGGWGATVPGVTKRRTQLSDWTEPNWLIYFNAHGYFYSCGICMYMDIIWRQNYKRSCENFSKHETKTQVFCWALLYISLPGRQ